MATTTADLTFQSPSTMERLDFCLPEFTRLAWVGEPARRVWEPRLQRIRRVWTDIEWLSVTANLRRCALIAIPSDTIDAAAARWAQHRLSAVDVPLPTSAATNGLLFVLVGALDDITAARAAWVGRADDVLGQLLGYPECCRRFFQRVWTELKCIDTTWSMAANTSPPQGAVIDVSPSEPTLANILWRWAGVRAVPHLPCSFSCEASQAFGERLLQIAEAADASAEAAWIREILSWPVEWSALHGIAEIKTPILRLSTRTDATPSKYVVRKYGAAYPDEGAAGLHFPYRNPARTRLTESRGFQRGMGQALTKPTEEWQYRDNGFTSSAAMNELHDPIVTFALQVIGDRAGNVLDLGCGNGALLAKLCRPGGRLLPYGVDRNGTAILHARQLLPSYYSNMTVADLFDDSIWQSGRRYALTLLMPGRLLEVEPGAAARLMRRIEACSDAVVLYAYPDRARGSLSSLAATAGLALKPGRSAGEAVGLLEFTAPQSDVQIDWSRLAEPQEDQYDTAAVLRRARAGTLLELDPAGAIRGDTAPRIFDGAVAVYGVYRGLPEFAALSANYLDAPADHPNIAAAADSIRAWPPAFEQCKRLLTAIHPAIDASIPFASSEIYRGSSCHSFESLFGTLWSTIHCRYGLAEAIVHEMAHQKLRALGVSFESASTIVGNDPSLRYVSPIVKDRLRPMSAVLHAQYSYLYVTALDIHLIGAETGAHRRKVLMGVLRRNLARIREGEATLLEHFVPGPHGEEFMAGVSAWTRRILDTGLSLLE